MATILRGKQKGKKSGVHQFANDWIMLKNGDIYSPLSLKLTPKESEKVMNSFSVGTMWTHFTLDEQGFFHKRKSLFTTYPTLFRRLKEV
jgi:hypothetical protein